STEATLAAEKELEIASICTIDNYANGVKGNIDCKEIYKGAKKNLKNLEKILMELMKDYK
ncbi:MAG TPA: 6-oxopurine nucleoside phosphorylase, partial [Patescibacteria group bacterium]|nr:6-oxopurine nucleoside phosphorylase [Patescibacteria group bacterium]